MVVGFLFVQDMVVLLKKEKPDWQKGRFNGVGGKVEPGETAHDAMVREFEEEAGARIEEWKHFATLRSARNPSCRVHFFTATNNDVYHEVRQMTDEQIHFFKVPYRGVHDNNWIPNLKWLIPLAAQADGYDGPIFGSFR
jgi:8-oxo-dGTP diphosphatase